MARNFVSNYFDNKEGEALRSTITKNWDVTPKHLELLNIDPKAKRILEVGCGIGRLLKELAPTRDLCVGFDASNSMIKEGKEYCKDLPIDLYHCDGSGKLDYQDSSFDYAFSFLTFQHIPNNDAVKKYVSEMARLLKKKGKINIQFLTNDEFPGKETWTHHDLDDMQAYMKEVGFKNIKLIVSGRWSFIHGNK